MSSSHDTFAEEYRWFWWGAIVESVQGVIVHDSNEEMAAHLVFVAVGCWLHGFALLLVVVCGYFRFFHHVFSVAHCWKASGIILTRLL